MDPHFPFVNYSFEMEKNAPQIKEKQQIIYAN